MNSTVYINFSDQDFDGLLEGGIFLIGKFYTDFFEKYAYKFQA
jgi:hypothetical protein